MVSSVSLSVLATKVRRYLKTNNITLTLRVQNGLFIIDNVHTRYLGNCADLCEAATGVKFESRALSMCKPC